MPISCSPSVDGPQKTDSYAGPVSKKRRINRRENAKLDADARKTNNPKSQDTVWPEQSGMVTPFLRLRLTSMRPHLSSHSLPFSLKMIFHGSSKAENLRER